MSTETYAVLSARILAIRNHFAKAAGAKSEPKGGSGTL